MLHLIDMMFVKDEIITVVKSITLIPCFVGEETAQPELVLFLYSYMMRHNNTLEEYPHILCGIKRELSGRSRRSSIDAVMKLID